MKLHFVAPTLKQDCQPLRNRKNLISKVQKTSNVRGEVIVIISLLLLYLLMHPDRFCGNFFEILVDQEGRQIWLKT